MYLDPVRLLYGQAISCCGSGFQNNPSYGPVSKHSNPDCHWAEPLETDKIYTKAKSERPHSDTGCDHGKLYISGSSQTICWNKSHYPYDWLDNRDPGHHMEAHLGTFRFHSTQFCYWNGQGKYKKAACNNNDLCKNTEFLDIINSLILPACSKAHGLPQSQSRSPRQ